MSDDAQNNPPKGDFEKAEQYVNQLVNLLNTNKIEVFRTDLKKFDPTSLQEHYTIALRDYQIEISHSKQPNTGKDSFIMIFNNLRNISEGNPNKVILAYLYLADGQFNKFKLVADRQVEERRRAEEEKRFKEAIQPIDQLLEEVSSNSFQEPKPMSNESNYQASSSSSVDYSNSSPLH